MFNRYFERKYEDEYYIFDSFIITPSEFNKKLLYEGYKAFEDSMGGTEVVDTLNELVTINRQLNNEIRRYRRWFKRLEKDWGRLYDYLIDNQLMTEKDILKAIQYI